MGARAVSKKPSLGRLKAPSLLPHGLKEKLAVAFSLMSVVPLLVLGYVVVNHVFPRVQTIWDVSLVAMLAGVIAMLGMAVARGLVMPAIKLAAQAREIARGNLERTVDVDAPDELGSLGEALNQITERVRKNMAQLVAYGEQAKHMNLEINRRVLALSHLLQVSNLISQSARIEEITAFVLEKLTQMEETPLNCLLEADREEGGFVVRAVMGADLSQAEALRGARVISRWLDDLLQARQFLVLDQERRSGPGAEFIQEAFGMAGGVFQPVVCLGQAMGLLISLNEKPDYVFREDCLDLLRVFGKQLAIALENDLLAKRAEELKVIDELTGLYNAGYMKGRLEEEVRRAIRYHRPCALVLLKLDDFQKVRDFYGALAAEGVLHQMGDLLKGQVTEVDRAGRMGPDEFAAILPERNKREALEIAEAIRQAVGSHSFANGPQTIAGMLSVSVGVSENPLDGSSGEELFAKAEAAVQSATRLGKNRVAAV